jgi:hypothetical protein
MLRATASKARREICLDQVTYLATAAGAGGRFYGAWTCQACAVRGTHGRFVSSVKLANRMADLLVVMHHQLNHLGTVEPSALGRK